MINSTRPPSLLKASPIVLSLLKQVQTSEETHHQAACTARSLQDSIGIAERLKVTLVDTIMDGMGLKGHDGRENIQHLVQSFLEINEWTMSGTDEPEPVGPLLLGGRGRFGEPAPPRLSLAVRDVIAHRLEVAIAMARSMASPEEQSSMLHRLTASVVEHINTALDVDRVPSLFELCIRALIASECVDTEQRMRETARSIAEIEEELTQLHYGGANTSTDQQEPPPEVEELSVEGLAGQLPPAFRQLIQHGGVDGAKLWTMLQDEIAENRQDVAFKRQITATQTIHSLETTLVQLDEQREIEWDEALFRYRIAPTDDDVAALNRWRLWLYEAEPERLCGASGELLPPTCPLCGSHTTESAQYSLRDDAEDRDSKAIVGFRCTNGECVANSITCQPSFRLDSLATCHNASQGCTTLFLREEWATRCKTCNVPWCSACQETPEVSRRNFCKSCRQGFDPCASP